MLLLKVKKSKKIACIPSPSPSVKIQIMGGKVCLRCKGETLLGKVNKILKAKFVDITQQCFAYYLQQTFPPMIWIFTQGEEDEIETKLSFLI